MESGEVCTSSPSVIRNPKSEIRHPKTGTPTRCKAPILLMLKPPISDPNSPTQPSSQAAPRWETWTMALSFVALWVWFLAYQNAGRAGEPLSLLWQAPLLISVALLVWIFVRRMRRALAGLKEVQPARRGRPGRN